MFDYDLDFSSIDFRESPELYRVGRGEQGVLLCEPYKSELLKHWRFATVAAAKKSANELLADFANYRSQGDFAGMDMARKFLQMGYTRSRRYANHSSGKKYDGPVPKHLKGHSGAHGRSILPRDEDTEKARAAVIFKNAWEKVESCRDYLNLRSDWKSWYG